MATGRINDLWHRKDRTRTTRYGTGKRWQAVWTDNQSKETKKSFDYKDAAQKWLDGQITDNTLNPHALKPDLPFSDYWNLWRERQAHQRRGSLKTLDSHCTKWVVPSFKDKTLRSITRSDVQTAVNSWTAGGNAASTVGLMYTYTRQIFKEAVFDKYLRESPCVRVRVPEVAMKIFKFTPKLLDDLIQILPEPYSAAAVIGAATGLRPGELRGLSKNDIDFQSEIIRVTLQDTSKSYSEITRGPVKTRWSVRDVGFGPSLSGLLLPLWNDAGDYGRLFHVGGRPCLFEFNTEWDRARVKLPQIGPGWHQLRHYHASALISAGVSPVAVAARLGHKDATVTLKEYAHLWDSDTESMSNVAESIVEACSARTATEPPQVA